MPPLKLGRPLTNLQIKGKNPIYDFKMVNIYLKSVSLVITEFNVTTVIDISITEFNITTVIDIKKISHLVSSLHHTIAFFYTFIFLYKLFLSVSKNTLSTVDRHLS